MQEANLPGMAACIIKNGKIQWAKGYGWADIEKQIPVTPDTVFGVASISKSVTATALMQLYEQGRFGLDEAINQYLPFPVKNPKHPLATITFRQLITHTSSIKHGFEVAEESRKSGDTFRPLGVFMHEYFVPGGRYYSDENFHTFSPRKKMALFHFGIRAGWLHGRSDFRSSFPRVLRKKSFQLTTLGMKSTKWFRTDFDTSSVATFYKYNPGSQGYTAIPPYRYADYPGAGLHSSVERSLTLPSCSHPTRASGRHSSHQYKNGK